MHKHQATDIAGIGLTYAYDANGNVTTRGGSPITWSSYNYPISVTVVSQAGSETVGLWPCDAAVGSWGSVIRRRRK